MPNPSQSPPARLAPSNRTPRNGEVCGRCAGKQTVSLGGPRSIENREHSVSGCLVLAIEITGIPQSIFFTTKMEQKRSRRPVEDGVRQRLFRARSTLFCGGGEEWRRRDFCFFLILPIASGRITANTMSA